METQSVLAVPKGEDKEMDVYVSTQHPAIIQVMQSILRESVWTCDNRAFKVWFTNLYEQKP